MDGAPLPDIVGNCPGCILSGGLLPSADTSPMYAHFQRRIHMCNVVFLHWVSMGHWHTFRSIPDNRACSQDTYVAPESKYGVRPRPYLDPPRPRPPPRQLPP
jgi:hypothetical protein